MSPVPASAITIADGEITIDAELLAPKLGLSAEALKAEMRKGNVHSVAETGINEDAGGRGVSCGRAQRGARLLGAAGRLPRQPKLDANLSP